MFTKIRLCDAVGKTIQAAEQAYQNDIVIAFTDGTYVALHARTRYDESEIDEIDVANIHNWEARHAAVKAGAMTNEEEIEQRQAANRKTEAEGRAARRKQYEQLRREFGE
jgi:hypothetical protein